MTCTTAVDRRLQQTRLHVADSPAGIRQIKTGSPKIGNLAYQTTHSPLARTCTYMTPQASPSLDANGSVVIAAHAAFVRVDGSVSVESHVGIATVTYTVAGTRPTTGVAFG